MSSAHPYLHWASRWWVLFASGFALALPFPYRVLPQVGNAISAGVAFLLAQAGWRSETGLPLWMGSDSPGLYAETLLLAAVAAVGASLWQWRSNNSHTATRWFEVSASYYLALHLAIYGFDKVFKAQFYLPEPNTLYTPLGQLSPDLLFWSTMGVSRTYTVFAGLIEVLPACLLLWRPLRPIGAVIASAVLLQVVMLNFSFDISVKVHALFLLALSVSIAAPACARTWRALRDGTRWQSPVSLFSGRKKVAIKAVILLLIAAESLWPYLRAGHYNDDATPRPYLHGAYEVQHFMLNGDTLAPLLSDSLRWRRFFVHRRGYFVVQDMNDRFRDYAYAHDPVNHALLLHNGDTAVFLAFHPQKDTLLLRGRWENDSIVVVGIAQDWRKLPALQSQWHWFTPAADPTRSPHP